MKSFKTYFEDLSEQAQAKKGDWKGGEYYLESISLFGYNTDYDNLGNITTPSIEGRNSFMLLEHKSKNLFKLGELVTYKKETKIGLIDETVFNVIFSITLKPEMLKHYNNSFSVPGVSVDLKLASKKGLATFMYKYFVKEKKFTIVGDTEQYFGARKLWAKLSNEIDVKVDIYDTNKQEIIFKNVILHHGSYNSDFDERLWSYSKSKNSLRSILTEILD